MKRKASKKKKTTAKQAAALVFLAVLVAAYIFGLRHETEIDKALSLVQIETYDSGDVVQVGRLTVHFLDVGNADSCLIELPDNKLMLIDGGENDSKTKNKLDSYLADLSAARKSNGRGEITKFDYGVITHSHQDHIGSMDYVLNRYPFGTFYRPNEESTAQNYSDPATGKSGKHGFWGSSHGSQSSSIYKNVISAVYSRSDEVVVTNPNDASQNTIAPSVSFTHEKYYEINFYGHKDSYYSNVNNFSPIIIIEYKGRRIALSGDAEARAESDFVQLAAEGKGRYSVFTTTFNVDVIKLGHHGSNTSNSEEFLSTLVSLESYRQNVFIFIPTDGKSYNHPSQEVLDRLKSMRFSEQNIYRADVNGDVALSFILSEGSAEAFCELGGVIMPRVIYKYAVLGVQVRYQNIGLALIVISALVLVPPTFLSAKNKKKIAKAAKKSAQSMKK